MLQFEYKQWEVYQQAVLLTKEIYRVTEGFPSNERAVLTFTLRRLAISLCQNLATGLVKRKKARKRILKTCIDDCIALDTQLELAEAIRLITAEQAAALTSVLEALYKKISAIRKSKVADMGV